MIHYITGRSGSGKTAKLYALVREALESGFSGNVLVIVPEQFTFETERALLSSMPKRGCLHMDVCSFDRLVFRVLAETGGLARTFLSRPGKDMLIRKVLDETETVLSSFGRVSRRAGFAKVCGEWIATFKRSGVEPEMLETAAKQIKDEALSNKLHDLARVFAEVERHLGERYMDLEDALRLFLEHAPRSAFLRASKVFVDGFDQLAKQDYDMLEAIMLHAQSLTVTLRLPNDSDADANIFAPEKHVFRTLRELAAKNGVPEEILPASNPAERTPCLRALERNLFAPNPGAFEGDGSVRLYECQTPEAETLACARRIARLVREGARYRDIAVLIPDFAVYSPHIERYFTEHAIPFFIDAKRPLTSHSISDFLLGAVSAAALNFRRSDMQRVLKSGYAMDDDDLAERLSVYLARTGIRDASRPFTLGDESGEMESARQALAAPLLALRGAMKAHPTAIGCAEALYRYVEAVKLGETLLKIADRLKDEKRYDLARTNAQVYSILMQTLDQIAGVFGDTPMDGARFLSVLEEGVRPRTVGIIPTTADQVLVGDIARTISQSVSVVMALGCNEGLLPRQATDDELLSRAECDTLEEFGISGWPGGEQKAARERMDIYAAFSRAERRLDLSYALASGGEKLSPSPLIDAVRRVFPRLAPSTDDGGLYTPRAAFGPLISALRALRDSGEAPSEQGENLASVYAWFSQNAPWDAALSRADAALFAQGGMEALPSEISRKLFARGYTTASRIETFTRCPFQHFARYGLAPNTREEYAPHAPDAGSFLHTALDALTKKALEERLNWATIDSETALEMLETLWEPMLAEFQNGLLQHNPVNKLLARRLKRMIADCFAAVAVHMAAGDFQVAASELRIGGEKVPPLELTLESGETVLLTGIVDRVDAARVNGAAHYRVVDYKTGDSTLSLSELYFGHKLQLPLYMSAILGARPGAKCAGLFYMGADAPLAASAKERLKGYRLSGYALRDAKAVGQMDRQGEGLVLSARIKKDGTVYGSALDEELMQKTLERARRLAEAALSRALEGDARAHPLSRNKRLTCDYCDFAAICGFDEQIPGFKPNAPPALSEIEFKERMEDEI